MSRTGKIARLPLPIREKINQRLQDGEKGKRIVQWLNSLPEVAAVMAADFGGQPINEVNLTHWKQGGYPDWETEQLAINGAQSALQKTGAGGDDLQRGLSERMAHFLAAKMAAELVKPVSRSKQTRSLDAWSMRLARLRRGEFQAKRIAIARDKLELLGQIMIREMEMAASKERPLGSQSSPLPNRPRL